MRDKPARAATPGTSTGTACRAPTRALTDALTYVPTPPPVSLRNHRVSIRLPGYDYAREGAYFITICTYNREWLFGEIDQGEMRLNINGNIVQKIWIETPTHFPHITMGEFVVMPNHMHGIIIINPAGKLDSTPDVGARHAVPLHPTDPHPQQEQFGKPTIGTIPTIVRSFKSAVTKRINEQRSPIHEPVWQRNYWEHVIRDEKSFEKIATYIVNNPANWELDKLFPGEKP